MADGCRQEFSAFSATMLKSGTDLVAAVLVEDDQEDGHDHDDADHDDGVEDGIQ